MKIGDLEVNVSREVSEQYQILVAINIVEGVSVEKNEEETSKYLSPVINEVKQKYTVETLKDDSVIRAYRDFYWRIGIDPTKQRPSSEALIRRVLRGKGVPIINNVVDAGNIASIKTAIPIGLYDKDAIIGNLVFRFAKENEIFDPIGGKQETLKANQVVLADDEGIIHVFPHRDSRRTMIRESTKRVLVVACGVPSVPDDLVLKASDVTVEYIIKMAGGKPLLERSILIK